MIKKSVCLFNKLVAFIDVCNVYIYHYSIAVIVCCKYTFKMSDALLPNWNSMKLVVNFLMRQSILSVE